MDTKLLLEHLYVCIRQTPPSGYHDLGNFTYTEVSLLIAGLQLLLREEQREAASKRRAMLEDNAYA